MKRRLTNVAASVHARLLDRAKAEGRPFNELLQYYAMERFLYRLSQSGHSDRFVLKGALMLQFWGGPVTRATKDIDLLGRTTVSVAELVDVFRSCVAVPVDDDGLQFDETSVTGEAIRLDAEYDGVRVRCKATLGNARVNMQVDIGFGDIVTPGAQEIVYPTLLDFDAPRLLGYTPESCIAEKFQAMVVLDMANTRLKDFLDVWILARGREFSGTVLADAIEATFRRRQTALPSSTPPAFTAKFYSSPTKKTQWSAYVRKARIPSHVPPFEEIAIQIEAFVTPVVEALGAGGEFSKQWTPGGPWRAGAGDR